MARSLQGPLWCAWLAAACLGGCGPGSESAPSGQGSAGERRFNVLLITLDTTRADRLGCYGYGKADTAALDSLAAGGLRFNSAFTHVPLTLPSHASILAGSPPPENGVRDNGRGRLADDVPLLQEAFSKRGYHTAAFLASFVLDKQFGLARGFDVYDDRMQPPPQGADNVYYQQNPANVVADRALAWLDANAGEPFFCWAHFYDPHLPYEPPEQYRQRLEDPYDGEIAFMDSQVKRLLDFLGARGLRDRTLIVAVGDHGEAFGEHEEFGHGPLVYRTTLHVPLILSLPGRIEPGRTDTGMAGLADIAPTILGLLNWPVPDTMTGRCLLSAAGRRDAVYGESDFLRNSYGWASLRCLQTAQWKYIDCPVPELYDCTADPGELRNLVAAQPEIAAAMKDRLASLIAGMKTRQAGQVALDERALAALRELGYLGGAGAAAPAESADRKDPKSMMQVYRACEQATALLDKHEYKDAAALLEPCLVRSPESPELRKLLAQARMGLGQFGAAKAHVEAYLARCPSDRTLMAYLGEIVLREGKPAEAARIFREILRMPPGPLEPFNPKGISTTSIKTRVNLAVALLRQNQQAAAVQQFELVLQDEADNFEAHANLAGICRADGRYPQAIRHYREALKQASGDASIHAGLAAALLGNGQVADAIGEYRQALRINPHDAVVHSQLAEALLRDGQKDLALFHVSEAARILPDSCEVHRQRGDVLEALGRRQDALEAYRKALDLARAAGSGDTAALVERRIRELTTSRPASPAP